MARLVAAFGSSHSIMLVAQREDWMHGFRVLDQKNAHYFDRQGRPTDYATLLAAVPPHAQALQTPEVMSQRYDAAQAAMDRVADAIAAARLDVLLIVGDDQTELFRTSNNPAIAIFHGPTIRNTRREPPSPADPWIKTARMWRHEPGADREYPVRADLAAWLTRQLCDRDFDIAAMGGLEDGQSEGHAFQFVHRRLLRGAELPVIPVILNTFDAPNQPTPRRCVALGSALRELVALWPEDLRVGVIASGGLSHFVVDEELDARWTWPGCRRAAPRSATGSSSARWRATSNSAPSTTSPATAARRSPAPGWRSRPGRLCRDGRLAMRTLWRRPGARALTMPDTRIDAPQAQEAA
jgi:3-O-methylgallate 3,4-dioxygenase